MRVNRKGSVSKRVMKVMLMSVVIVGVSIRGDGGR